MDYGLIVDLETTGLSAEKDEIIEIGLLEFAVGGNKLPSIARMYSGLEDPGQALTDEIVQITGLTDDLLHGQKIDWGLVREWIANASIVIAHNVEFDAGFLRQRRELVDLDIHWGCSASHINWREQGFKTRALNYLAADHGFVNPFAHRALFDCATTFRLIAPHLTELIDKSYERRFLLAAVGSPFETKDKLKQRGYRWDRDQRVWSKMVLESELEDERLFLAEEVYDGEARHQETEIQSDLG